MATTADYLDYLNDRIGIAPANSQEEVQAAETIADVFRDHGLEPTVQDFAAPANVSFVYGILFVVAFVGALLSGLPATAVSVIGILLTLVSAALLVMRYLGHDVLGSFGPTIRSQNVIGFHQASGELVAKGNRPIVIVAHYDTPHEDPFYKAPLAQYQTMLKQACIVLVPVVAVLAVFQAFGFIPVFGRRMLWIIELVCALPLLLWGVTIIVRRFSSCTLGSNDNKSSVAAMLGVLSNVCPANEDEAEQMRASRESRLREVPVSAPEATGSEPEGVRHGEEVIRALGILPESCEIVYARQGRAAAKDADDTQVVASSAQPEPFAPIPAPAAPEPAAAAPEPESDKTSPMAVPTADSTASVPNGPEGDSNQAGDTVTPAPSADDDADKTILAPMPAEMQAPADAPAPNAAAASRVRAHNVPSSRVPSIDGAPSVPSAGRTQPAQTSRASSAARRAALFDLPDPLHATVDPLDADVPTDVDATIMVPSDQGLFTNPGVPEPVRISDDANNGVHQDEIGVVSPSDLEAHQTRRRRGIFGRRKKQQDEESMSDWLGVDDDYDAKKNGRDIGSWDNLDKDDEKGTWKGGAAPNGRFRVIEGNGSQADADAYAEDAVAPGQETLPVAFAAAEPSDAPFDLVEDAPGEDEMRDAVLSMGDDELLCHDIWFVALGASEVGHAGMNAFLDEYRRQCRGAFLINLDCVGAGDLTVLTDEGLDNRRKADRRLIGLLSSTARDIHVDLASGSMAWDDTDATPAMRTSMRSATIVGLDEFGLPAYKRSMEDAEDAVSHKQVEDVCALVTEAIRRS